MLGPQAVAIAKRYLGIPYVWGGSTPTGGFDCSGLVMYVYKQLGITLDHYAAWQYLEGRRIAPDELQPGDLVFWEPKADGPGHVGMYVGDGKMINAPHTGDVVRIVSIQGRSGTSAPSARSDRSTARAGACPPRAGCRRSIPHVTGPETISLLTPRVEPGSSVSPRSGQRRPLGRDAARRPAEREQRQHGARLARQRDGLAGVNRNGARRADARVDVQRRVARRRQQHELGEVVVEARARRRR